VGGLGLHETGQRVAPILFSRDEKKKRVRKDRLGNPQVLRGCGSRGLGRFQACRLALGSRISIGNNFQLCGQGNCVIFSKEKKETVISFLEREELRTLQAF
jgi:hypothetical protein